MLGLGVFQLWTVPSTPPLKHCSPLELMVTHSTAPLQRFKHFVIAELALPFYGIIPKCILKLDVCKCKRSSSALHILYIYIYIFHIRHHNVF